MEKVRLSIRKILFVLLIIWMITVFCLSHQTGESSSSLSRAVANLFAKGDTVEAETIEPVVRKVAHMMEYALGGILFYGFISTYPKLSIKARIIISFAFIIIYAGTDEFHQSFINSRSGSFIDVFIDTFGGALGIGAIFIIQRAISVMDNKVKENLESAK